MPCAEIARQQHYIIINNRRLFWAITRQPNLGSANGLQIQNLRQISDLLSPHLSHLEHGKGTEVSKQSTAIGQIYRSTANGMKTRGAIRTGPQTGAYNSRTMTWSVPLERAVSPGKNEWSFVQNRPRGELQHASESETEK